MATAKQKAAARRNIKKAQAAVRRKFGHRSRRSTGGTSGSETKHEPGLGATYQAAKGGYVIVGAPVVETGLANRSNIRGIPSALKTKVLDVSYAANVGVAVADGYIDTRPSVGQAAALSRGSITAWAPELYLGFLGVDTVRRTGTKGVDMVRNLNERLVAAHQGWNPTTGNFDIGNREFWAYRGLKHGGQMVRVLRSKLKIADRILSPVQKFAAMMGGTV